MNRINNSVLYIGDYSDAKDEKGLRDNGIAFVVNVAKELDNPHFNKIESIKIGLEDGSNDQTLYLFAAQIISSLIRSRKKVLVNSYKGNSRAAAIAIICLALDLKDYPGQIIELLEKAEKKVKKYRKSICVQKDHKDKMLLVTKLMRLRIGTT